MFESLSPLVSVAALFFTVFAAVWSLAWWLSGHFTNIRNLIYTQIEKVNYTFSEKLDYHEKHDDQRFNALSNDLWEIRLRNAAVDNTVIKRRLEADNIG